MSSTSDALLAAVHAWLAEDAVSDHHAAAIRDACLSVQHRLEGSRPHKRPRASLAASAPNELGTRRRAAEQSSSSAQRGELVLLGSGLKAMCHLTREAMAHLRAADVVFGALQPGGPDRRWLELALGQPIIDLNQLYPACPTADRAAAYVLGAEAALCEVRCGRRVCVIEYGHPCVAAAQSELLVREARREGHTVHVLPGVSAVDALWADLGVDPAVGCLLCTADALLRSAALRSALGPGLPHLALLMPDAVGDIGSGEDLATGRRSLADWPPWAELLVLLQRVYGADARCVLYRAPVWASTAESCMLSAPLASLACRSCIDGVVRAWGGDLGTMYVAGDGSGGGGGGGGDGGGERVDGGDGSGGERVATHEGRGVAPASDEAAHAAEPAGDQPPSAAVVARASAATAGGGALPVDKVTAQFQSSFDAERQAWLRRWAIFEVQHAAVSHAPVQTLLGTASPRSAVPPNSGYAFEAPSRATALFDAAALARLREGAAAAEELGGHGLVAARREAAAKWEPSDRAIQLQLAFAACARADAPAAVGELAERLDAAEGAGGAGGAGGWTQLAMGVTRASALHGQLGLPESGAAALWDGGADGCCPPLELEREVRATQGTESPPPRYAESLGQRFASARKEGE
jgi:hypothetical protein